MQKKVWFFSLGLVFLVGSLSGCETLRGAKKDADNTVKNVKRLPELDKWLQENAW